MQEISDICTVLQEVGFCFSAPQTIVLLHNGLQLLLHLTVGEVLYIGDGIVLLGIDDFLTAGQLGQLHDGLADIVQTHDVGGDLCQIHNLVLDTDNGILHILGIAAAGAYIVGGIVVDIVEIDGGSELGIGRTGEEVQTAVPGQQFFRSEEHTSELQSPS